VLLYELEFGTSELNMVKQALAMNRPVPTAIANAPRLQVGLEFFYEAYSSLGWYRRSVDGAVPLPYETILAFADEHGLEGEFRNDFIFYMQAMDVAQARFEFAEYEKQRKVAEKKINNGPRK
jgi:hypothetical protein